MLFDGIGSSISGEPRFRKTRIRDKNPLSRQEKVRTIHVPNKAMKTLHARIIRILRGLSVDLSSSSGVLPGSSQVKNVKRHRKNRYFYLVDIKSAFGSIHCFRLAMMLDYLSGEEEKIDQWLELSPDNALKILSFLERYCLTEEGGLITGAPASPDLFNIYAALDLDAALVNLYKRHEITYSRYVDDLVFSALKPIGKRKRKSIRSVITGSGFGISHHKCQVADLAQGTIEINGVGLELGGRVFLPRWYLRRIRGLIHKARKTRSRKLLARVDGMMGVFWSVTGKRRASFLNRTEHKLVQAHRDLHKYIRGKPPKRHMGISATIPRWQPPTRPDDFPF